MLSEPSIDKQSLCAQLGHLFGLIVTGLSFVPKGEESWSYRVDCDDQARYFLKIQHISPPSRDVLDFVGQLRQKGHLDEVVCPLPTLSGEPLFFFAGYSSMLFEFIDAPSLADSCPSSGQLFRVGETLARIHACVDVRAGCPTVERFQIPFEGEYAGLMRAVKASRQNLRADQSRVAGLLRSSEKKLDDRFEQLRTGRQRLQGRDLELVVCHGEPSPGNVLVSADRVHFVDWNTVILAPRERDLVFFLEPEYQAVLDGYWSVTNPRFLADAVVSFYRRHWMLGEIVYFGSRLLFSDSPDTQIERDTALFLQALAELDVC